MRRAAPLIAIALCAGISRLPAQTQAERAMLAAWDDSLQRVPTAASITALDGSSRLVAGRAGELRRALFLVRRAGLKDERKDIELVLTNMQVLANHSASGWPYLVMARAFETLAMKEWVETLSDGKVLAEKHSDALWRTLRLALSRDSTLAPARRIVAGLTAAQGDRFLRPDQEITLRRETRQPDAGPDALLAWGRHQRTLREYQAALATFSRALQLGGDHGRLQLELARTLLAARDTAAAIAAYWAGAAHLSPTGREMYRFDLAWITDSATLEQFDQLDNAAIPSWLHRFWNSRDAEAGNHSGDRLREHLRRWVFVMEHYRALSPWQDAFFSRVELGYEYAPEESRRLSTSPDAPIKSSMCIGMDADMYVQLWRMQPSHRGDLRSREPLLDHRGLIYLRHGEPQRRIDGGGAQGGGLLGGTIARRPRSPIVAAGQARGPNGVLLPWSAEALGESPALPNGPAGETWIYGLGGEWHILQFRGSEALGRYAATTMTQRIPAEWLEDPRIAATIPGMTYVQLTKRINDNEASPLRIALRNAMDKQTCFKESMAVADQTRADEHFFIKADTDTPPDLQPSNSVYQVFALGVADDRSGKALLSFALASEALQLAQDSAGQTGYPMQFHVVAYDKLADRTIELDTLQYFAAARRLAPGQFLTAHFEMTLPAGTWHVAARVRHANGAAVINDSRTIRIDGAASIALSDIVTGRPGTPDWTATDGTPFPVNYTNGWYRDENAELFYEVRGVPPGAMYRTSITIRPVDPKARTSIQFSSDDRGAGGVTFVRKSLGLDQLAPGTYTLLVVVEYSGMKVARERRVLIAPRP